MSDFKQSLAARIKALRGDRTQQEVADTSNIPIGTIRDYEQARREPLLSNAVRLAEALGVTLDELAGINKK